ncbi:MAG: N-formylglutamate deformylase [Gammaproteobacteria bacterium]|nr:N-formylglutamate deformylase [Gammaproteobacteria bacterium]
MDTFSLVPGKTRLLVSIPHAGTHVPPEIARRLTSVGRALPDTDWHVDRLYSFAADLGATVLTGTHSRYVVDLNRPPDDTPLYPGLAGSGLCPVQSFAGKPLWRARQAPDEAEVAERRMRYWQPYHACLRGELDRLLARHGSVVLWDAHSIRSRVPGLFAGTLPVLNLGTYDGRSCDEGLAARLFGRAIGIPGCTAVMDARFKGGYITRAYGDPLRGLDAVQLELAQRSYMDESSREYLPEPARQIRLILRALLEIALAGS